MGIDSLGKGFEFQEGSGFTHVTDFVLNMSWKSIIELVM
jgi:hypothetical protein